MTSPLPARLVHINLGVIPSPDSTAKNGEAFLFRNTRSWSLTPMYA